MRSNVLPARLQAPFGEKPFAPKRLRKAEGGGGTSAFRALCGSPRRYSPGKCIPPDEVHPALAMGKYLGLFFNYRVSVFSVASGVPACSAFSQNAHPGQPWHLSVDLIIWRRNGRRSSHDG